MVSASKSKVVFNPYPYAAMDKAPTQQLPTHEASASRQGELGLELDSAVQGVQDNVRPAEAEVVIDVEREGVELLRVGVDGREEEVAGDGRVLEGVEPHEETGLPVPYGFKLMQTTAKPELIKNQSHSQNQNMNGLQTRPDETNYLELHEESDHDNINPKDYLVHESQEGGVSKQILDCHISNDFTAHSSLNPFGGEHHINGQHSGLQSKAVFNPYPYAAMDKAPTQQLPTHEASVSRQGIPGNSLFEHMSGQDPNG
nr:hypothetical protein [Tanacetum cinerariifolium]